MVGIVTFDDAMDVMVEEATEDITKMAAINPLSLIHIWPSGLWTNYIKYIGAGAVAAGGVISLIKTFPLIIRTFKQAVSSMGKKHQDKYVLRTQQDLPMSVLLILIAAIVILIWLIPTCLLYTSRCV